MAGAQVFRVTEPQNCDRLTTSLLDAVANTIYQYVDIIDTVPAWRSLDSARKDDEYDLHWLSMLFRKFEEAGLQSKFTIQDGVVKEVPQDDAVNKRMMDMKAELMARISTLEELVAVQDKRLQIADQYIA